MCVGFVSNKRVGNYVANQQMPFDGTQGLRSDNPQQLFDIILTIEQCLLLIASFEVFDFTTFDRCLCSLQINLYLPPVHPYSNVPITKYLVNLQNLLRQVVSLVIRFAQFTTYRCWYLSILQQLEDLLVSSITVEIFLRFRKFVNCVVATFFCCRSVVFPSQF